MYTGAAGATSHSNLSPSRGIHFGQAELQRNSFFLEFVVKRLLRSDCAGGSIRWIISELFKKLRVVECFKWRVDRVVDDIDRYSLLTFEICNILINARMSLWKVIFPEDSAIGVIILSRSNVKRFEVESRT